MTFAKHQNIRKEREPILNGESDLLKYTIHLALFSPVRIDSIKSL